MKSFLSLLFLVIMVTGSHLAKHSNKRSYKKRYEQNCMACESFRCKKPQPRVIPIEKLYAVSSALSYVPRATVLDRCSEDSGCCNRDEVCRPVESRRVDVQLFFHVTDIFESRKQSSILV
ncbi:hypothetical protein L9F63_005239, partial [Diploptera punctata]